jgi:cytidyltransferase-like protein
MRKVMVFGVFDGVHEGHRAMLKEAKNHGDFLVAVVAQDHIVERLKGHLPCVDMTDRFEHLQNEDGVDQVVIGDAELGTWGVVQKHQPDVIALGYDQASLKVDLEEHLKHSSSKLELVILKSFEPNTYKSSYTNCKL